jgi:hypothetical protein
MRKREAAPKRWKRRGRLDAPPPRDTILGAFLGRHMGDFDFEITWCKERRALAEYELREIDKGHRYYLDDEDITAKVRDRAAMDMKMMDALVIAYEAHNKA